jgi:YgiT-type zinc finger domain-containing protein
MICLICRQAKIVDGFVSVNLERGETHLVIKNVPARVCYGCGEAFVNEQVAVRLLRGADEASGTGMLEDVIEYERFR